MTDFRIRWNVFGGSEVVEFLFSVQFPLAIDFFFHVGMVVQRAVTQQHCGCVSVVAESIGFDGGIAQPVPKFCRQVNVGTALEDLPFFNGARTKDSPSFSLDSFHVKRKAKTDFFVFHLCAFLGLLFFHNASSPLWSIEVSACS